MRKTSLLLCLGFSLILPVISNAQSTGPQAGQKVAFLGDSITQFGWSNPTGYVHLVDMALEQQGKKIVVVPAGVSGNTSKDMLGRLTRNVLSQKPDWMTLSCGVNDVWHGVNGVQLDQYKVNITSIVDQATAAGIKVIILTSTMIMEDQANDLNQKLVAYNDFLHALAKEKQLPVAELNVDEQAELSAMKTASPNLKGNLLTVDGVHMNGLGNQMMAAGILKAMGFTDAQLAQAKASWMDLPGAMNVAPKGGLSVKQYLHLQGVASSEGKSVDNLVNDAWAKDLQALMDTPALPTSAAPTASTNAAPAKP